MNVAYEGENQNFYCLKQWSFIRVYAVFINPIQLTLVAQCLSSPVDNFAPGDCHWITGGSGDHIQCLPDYYIDGTCGSGSREDCRFSLRDHNI